MPSREIIQGKNMKIIEDFDSGDFDYDILGNDGPARDIRSNA